MKFLLSASAKLATFLFYVAVPCVALAVPAIVLYNKDFSVQFSGSAKDVELAAQIAQSQISKGLFEIFLSVSAVVVAITTLLGFNAYIFLKRSLENSVSIAIEERLRLSHARLLAQTFNELSYVWFKIYEPILQQAIASKLDPKEAHPLSEGDMSKALEAIDMALTSIQRGQDAIDGLSKVHKNTFFNEYKYLRLHIHLMNHEVYATTAELILKGKSSKPAKLDKIKKLADKLKVSVRRGVASQYGWYDAYETFGFFCIHAGMINCDKKLINEGRTTISNLIEGEVPKRRMKSVPNDQKEALIKEYFERGLLEIKNLRE